MLEKLGNISQLMEGENYILSSMIWGALFDVEQVLQPDLSDSAVIAEFRAAMFADHFSGKRVTFSASIKQALAIFMHFLDPRFVLLF